MRGLTENPREFSATGKASCAKAAQLTEKTAKLPLHRANAGGFLRRFWTTAQTALLPFFPNRRVAFPHDYYAKRLDKRGKRGFDLRKMRGLTAKPAPYFEQSAKLAAKNGGSINRENRELPLHRANAGGILPPLWGNCANRASPLFKNRRMAFPRDYYAKRLDERGKRGLRLARKKGADRKPPAQVFGNRES